MVAQTTRKGFWNFLRGKPAKPSTRGNVVAFKVGARSFKRNEGSTPDLQKVVMMSLENDARTAD